MAETSISWTHTRTPDPSWLVPDDDREIALMVNGKTYATITRWTDNKTKEHCWFTVERFSDGKILGLHVRFENACKAATDDAGVVLAPPADLASEWEDLPDEPSAAAVAAPVPQFSNARFAQRATVVASKASRWARDILDTPEGAAKRELVENFCSEISDCLESLREAVGLEKHP